MNKNKIVVNGETYIKKESTDSKQYVIVRTYSAGCFAGYLESYGKDCTEVNLTDARRLWVLGWCIIIKPAGNGGCKKT